MSHYYATRELMTNDLENLNLGRVTRTRHQLVPPFSNYHTASTGGYSTSTDLACTVPIDTAVLQLQQDSSSRYFGHEFVIIITRLSRPPVLAKTLLKRLQGPLGCPSS
ncbi:hypothetical protein TNCV_3429201 [Trichonephila clavipes]|nr:hypothetical protein TNCV_3429201 [Trichonephila clavipes]